MSKRRALEEEITETDARRKKPRRTTQVIPLPKHGETWECFEHVCSEVEAIEMFAQLKSLVDPIPHRIVVYGKETDEPRLTGMFSTTGGTFTYSNRARSAKSEWPDVIQRLVAIATAAYPKLHSAACNQVQQTCDCPAIEYDSALINLYRDGQDSVGWHRDKDAIDQPIASFTFYATDITNPRPFFVRPYGSPGADRMVWAIPNRSFLLMLPGMNLTHEHTVPERAHFNESRINVTLRAHKRGTAHEVH